MSDIGKLVEFLHRHKNITVLSGAGCSTGSGIPDYRDDDGNWKNAQPVQYGDFVRSGDVRRRYWARSFAGWQRITAAKPNSAHAALARLEHAGYVNSLITQNVDNLHRLAGSQRVIDLHGVLHKTRCLGCETKGRRSDWQRSLNSRRFIRRATHRTISAISKKRRDGYLRATTSSTARRSLSIRPMAIRSND